jgi:hypothetical protein
MSGKEKAIAKSIETLAKSPEFSRKDFGTINKVLDMGGEIYRGDKDISKAVAAMNNRANENGWGKNVADNMRGALAKNQKAKDDAMNVH